MTVTKTIPAETLSGLDVHQGDTLRILAIEEAGVVIRVDRFEPGAGVQAGSAALWLQTSKGSVHLSASESAEDVRDEYYARKYGVKQ